MVHVHLMIGKADPLSLVRSKSSFTTRWLSSGLRNTVLLGWLAGLEQLPVTLKRVRDYKVYNFHENRDYLHPLYVYTELMIAAIVSLINAFSRWASGWTDSLSTSGNSRASPVTTKTWWAIRWLRSNPMQFCAGCNPCEHAIAYEVRRVMP